MPYNAKAQVDNGKQRKQDRSPGFIPSAAPSRAGITAQWHNAAEISWDLQLRVSSRFTRDSLLNPFYRVSSFPNTKKNMIRM